MNKQELHVQSSLPFLGIPLNDTYRVSSYTHEDDNFKYLVSRSLERNDIRGRALFRSNKGDKFEAVMDEDQRYALQAHIYLSLKDVMESTVIDKLNNNEWVLPVPCVNYHWNPMCKTFMETCAELDEKIAQMKHPDDVQTVNGKYSYVLRPNNATHSLLAFEVRFPEKFRMQAFDMIVRELKQLWEMKVKGLEPKQFEDHVRKHIEANGLLPISENLFGLHGVFSGKGENADQAQGWLLTPYITGFDARIMNVAGELFTHDGIGKQTNYADFCEPAPAEKFLDTEHIDELKVFFDNVTTFAGGVADFRVTNRQHLYFLEMSSNFSYELYSEQFINYAVKATLTMLGNKWKELVAGKNDDLYERQVAYKQQCKEEEDFINTNNAEES